MRRGAKAFVLTDGVDQTAYEELINKSGLKITAQIDGLTKEGAAIRVVDYREPDGRIPVYRPPIC